MKEGALDTEGAIYMLTEANRYPLLIAHMSKAIKIDNECRCIACQPPTSNYEYISRRSAKTSFWGRNHVKDSWNQHDSLVIPRKKKKVRPGENQQL